jgi:hypothetical protein
MNRTAAERALRAKVIRLAYHQPGLRRHLLPLLTGHVAADDTVEAGRKWDSGAGSVDDGAPYWPGKRYDVEGHPFKGKGMTNSKADKRKYNKWYREHVCVDVHATNCGLTKDQIKSIKENR